MGGEELSVGGIGKPFIFGGHYGHNFGVMRLNFVKMERKRR